MVLWGSHGALTFDCMDKNMFSCLKFNQLWLISMFCCNKTTKYATFKKSKNKTMYYNNPYKYLKGIHHGINT